MNIVKILICSLFVFFLIACKSTYTPKSLKGIDTTELSFVEADSEEYSPLLIAFAERLYITNINGKSTYSILNDGHAHSTYVEAGLNEFNVQLFHHQMTSTSCIAFETEPNKKYTIKKEIKGRKVYFWAIENGTEISISRSCKSDS